MILTCPVRYNWASLGMAIMTTAAVAVCVPAASAAAAQMSLRTDGVAFESDLCVDLQSRIESALVKSAGTGKKAVVSASYNGRRVAIKVLPPLDSEAAEADDTAASAPDLNHVAQVSLGMAQNPHVDADTRAMFARVAEAAALGPSSHPGNTDPSVCPSQEDPSPDALQVMSALDLETLRDCLEMGPSALQDERKRAYAGFTRESALYSALAAQNGSATRYFPKFIGQCGQRVKVVEYVHKLPSEIGPWNERVDAVLALLDLAVGLGGLEPQAIHLCDTHASNFGLVHDQTGTRAVVMDMDDVFYQEELDANHDKTVCTGDWQCNTVTSCKGSCNQETGQCRKLHEPFANVHRMCSRLLSYETNLVGEIASINLLGVTPPSANEVAIQQLTAECANAAFAIHLKDDVLMWIDDLKALLGGSNTEIYH